jgi:hypothetical protein
MRKNCMYPSACGSCFPWSFEGTTDGQCHRQSFGSLYTVGPLRACDAHLSDFLQTHATLRRLLDVLETDLRLEILGLSRLLDDAVELVDLLKGQAFRLVDKEPNESDTDETK